MKRKLKDSKLKVEEKTNKDPLLIMRGVVKDIEDEELLLAFKNQNREVLEGIPEEEVRIKVRYKRRARSEKLCHVVVEVSPKVWKAVKEAGTLHIGMQRVPVFDQSPLIQCSCCLGFGHGRKWCAEKIVLCSHCGGDHLIKNCPDINEEPKCKNY